MTIPAWLLRAHGGVFRTACLATCPRCGSLLLVGLDAEVAALTVRVDTTPVDELGEFLALAAGRTTYDLVPRNGSKKQLDRREPWHVKARRKYSVLPSHKCGQSINSPPPRIPTARKEAHSGEFPF